MSAQRALISLAIFMVSATSFAARNEPRPYSESEIRSIETPSEAQVRDIRQQEINQLRIALGRRLTENRRADLYFRLAEIYMEAYRTDFLLEGRAHERRLEKGDSEVGINRSRSKPHLRSGIAACEEILKFGRPYERLDNVYYFLGFNYTELGETKKALRYYELLTTKFPSSPFVAEAYREMGDNAFGNGKFRDAQKYYEVAIKRDAGARAPRILHRLAWAYYRTRDYTRAVSTMKEAVAKTNADNEKFLSIREEALRDLAIFMTETGRVDEAIEYFRTVAGDKTYYARALERLGKQYERNVQPEKAIVVYESMLKANPDDEASFRVRTKLVDLDLRRGRHRAALERLENLKIPSTGDQETQAASQNLRAMVRRTATEQHENFRRTGNRASLRIADQFYGAYLETFLASDDPRNEKPEIQMYLADVKRELGNSQDASQIYKQVIEKGDKRYAKEAAALWTASLADAIRKTGGKASGGAQAEEPSKLEREFVEAADEMSDSLGDTTEAREAAIKAAQVLAGYKKTQKDAIKRCEKIIERSPKSPQALIAAKLWIQTLSDQLPRGSKGAVEKSDAADDLRDAIEELRKNSVLIAADRESGQGSLTALLSEQENRLKVGLIAGAEADQDFASAARGYEAYAAGTKQRELAERAYGNSIASYAKVGDADGIKRVAAAWLRRYPDAKGAVDSIRSAATTLLIRGKFEAAGLVFERLGESGRDAESLETAARLYEGSGEFERAIRVRQVYLDVYRKSANRWSMMLAIAKTYEDLNKDAEAATIYRRCSGAPDEIGAECGGRLIDVHLRANNPGAARALMRRVANVKAKGSPFVAYARYRLAEQMELQAKFIPLQLPEKQLKRALTQRLEFLEPLSRAYNSAVEAGGPWGIAALDRLARWAAGFADEVDRIAPPPNVSGPALAQFQRNLKSISEPLRKKARETWADAYRKAVSANILSPALPEIADRIGIRAQGFRGRFRLAGISPDGGSEGRSAAFERIRARLEKQPSDASAWIDYGNLIWGEGRPLLAKIAYERALGLNRRNASALNNRGVVAISGPGEESWLISAEANSLFQDALSMDRGFLAAKMNRAILLNYYRNFAKARGLWEQVIARTPSADAYDGLGVALSGLGSTSLAEVQFVRAKEVGAPNKRFVRQFHEAVKFATTLPRTSQECLGRLGELDDSQHQGFERDAITRLRAICSGAGISNSAQAQSAAQARSPSEASEASQE